MHPWYRGFEGTFEWVAEKKIYVVCDLVFGEELIIFLGERSVEAP